jgi:hypothetical protein
MNLVCQFRCGLGNQMFQYAVASSIASQLGVDLMTDVSSFKNSNRSTHKYGLGNLKVRKPCEAPRADFVLKMWPRGPGPQCLLHDVTKNVFFRLAPSELVKEVGARLADGAQTIALNGFVFDEEFFACVAADIRREFLPVEPLRPLAVGDSTPVAMHIRRGDHLTQEHSAAGLLANIDRDYYQRALDHVLAREPSAHVLVFSDDIPWCKDNLDLECPHTFVEGKPSQDMEMMRQCKHHIIANSTFSWWGAWLAESPGQIVVTPECWYTRDSKFDENDIAPTRWVRM